MSNRSVAREEVRARERIAPEISVVCKARVQSWSLHEGSFHSIIIKRRICWVSAGFMRLTSSSSVPLWAAGLGWYAAERHQRRWWHELGCRVLRLLGWQAGGDGAWYAWPWDPWQRFQQVPGLLRSGIQGQQWRRQRLNVWMSAKLEIIDWTKPR